MENKKSSIKLIILPIAIVLIVSALFIFLWYARFKPSPINPAGAATGNKILVSKLPNGDQSVSNQAEGYRFEVPGSWYVEAADRGDEVAVYPDYSPQTPSSSPACKIELSLFPQEPGVSNGEWIAAHLAVDPTVGVSEESSEAISVSNYPAIKWTGTVDGATTSFVYIFGPKNVYEIAPSSLANTDASECAASMDVFIAKFNA